MDELKVFSEEELVDMAMKEAFQVCCASFSFFFPVKSTVCIHYLLIRGGCLQDQGLLDCSEQHPEGQSNAR